MMLCPGKERTDATGLCAAQRAQRTVGVSAAGRAKRISVTKEPKVHGVLQLGYQQEGKAVMRAPEQAETSS